MLKSLGEPLIVLFICFCLWLTYKIGDWLYTAFRFPHEFTDFYTGEEFSMVMLIGFGAIVGGVALVFFLFSILLPKQKRSKLPTLDISPPPRQTFDISTFQSDPLLPLGRALSASVPDPLNSDQEMLGQWLAEQDKRFIKSKSTTLFEIEHGDEILTFENRANREIRLLHRRPR